MSQDIPKNEPALKVIYSEDRSEIYSLKGKYRFRIGSSSQYKNDLILPNISRIQAELEHDKDKDSPYYYLRHKSARISTYLNNKLYKEKSENPEPLLNNDEITFKDEVSFKDIPCIIIFQDMESTISHIPFPNIVEDDNPQKPGYAARMRGFILTQDGFLRYKNKEIHLPPRLYDLISLLYYSYPNTCMNSEIKAKLEPDLNSYDPAGIIRDMRAKINPVWGEKTLAGKDFIENVRRYGYKLNLD